MTCHRDETTGVVSGTVPYAWPYHGLLDPAATTLVVCGAQRSLVAMTPGVAEVVERLAGLAGQVRATGGEVVWVRHGTRRRAGRTAPLVPARGSPGWQLAAEPAAQDVVVDAAGWDGCFGSDLDHAVRGARSAVVLLGGVASELTVDSTVRTLNDRGHECLVLTDGCAPLDAALGARAHHSLTMSGGIFGALGTIDAVADALSAAAPSLTTTGRSTP